MPSARTIWTACLTLCALSLVLHAALACYAHPMADDLSYAHKDISHGIWNATIWEYLHWNGRYASNFLMLLGPLRLGLNDLVIYRLVPVLLIAITCGSMAFFLRAMSTRFSIALPAWPFTLVWSGVFLCIMPDIGEGFYWYTGAVTYQFANALALLGVGVLLMPLHVAGRMVAMAILFITVGFNEVIMLLLVAAAMAGVIGPLMYRSRMPRIMLALLVVVLIGAGIMVLAPGNAGRGAHFPEQHRLWRSIGMSALQTVRFSAMWVLNIPMLALSLACLIHRERIEGVIAPFTRHLRPWMTIAAPLLLTFLCAFPAYWGTGILGQHRTMNVACLFFVPLWFLNLAVCSRAWLPRASTIYPERLTNALLLLFATCVLFTGNGYASVLDLFGGRAASASAQLRERYALLEAARATADPVVTIPLIEDPPRSIYLLDIRPDPEFLQNVDYAMWFGLEGRRIVPADQSDRAKSTN